MRLEHYPIDQLKRELLGIIATYLDLLKYQVFFFGSRIEGKGTDRSDIDVGIEGQSPIPAKTWLELVEEIQKIPTLYKIDIVDFSHVSSIFHEVATQHREFITI